MSIWGVIVIVGVVVLVGAFMVARGGKDERAARRELRQWRTENGRGVDTAAIADIRRAGDADHFPGNDSAAGGLF